MTADFEPPDWLDRQAYPFTHRFATLSAGRMHYVDEGHGEPILLVHGTPTWSFEYRHLMSLLPGATVVRLDDAGHWPHEERPDAVIRALNEWLGFHHTLLR